MKLNSEKLLFVGQRDFFTGQISKSDYKPTTETGINLWTCGCYKTPARPLASQPEAGGVLIVQRNAFMCKNDGEVSWGKFNKPFLKHIYFLPAGRGYNFRSNSKVVRSRLKLPLLERVYRYLAAFVSFNDCVVN